jgi:L-lactate permease
VETIQRDDGWWRRGDDGTWYRWNEATSAWEFAPVATATATTETYRSPRFLGRWLAALLAAAMVLDVVAAAAFYDQVRVLTATSAGEVVSQARLDAADTRLGILALAILTTLLATAPVFVVWFQRLYRNADALGATGLRFSRGWAIGAWFVPVLNLWRPKQIADDIWRASDPDLPADANQTWRTAPVAGVVHAWWALYVLSSFINQAILRFSASAETTPELRTEALLQVGAASLDAVTAAVALLFVVRITARQELRASARPSVQA